MFIVNTMYRLCTDVVFGERCTDDYFSKAWAGFPTDIVHGCTSSMTTWMQYDAMTRYWDPSALHLSISSITSRTSMTNLLLIWSGGSTSGDTTPDVIRWQHRRRHNSWCDQVAAPAATQLLIWSGACTSGDTTPDLIRWQHQWRHNSWCDQVAAPAATQLLIWSGGCTSGDTTPDLIRWQHQWRHNSWFDQVAAPAVTQLLIWSGGSTCGDTNSWSDHVAAPVATELII